MKTIPIYYNNEAVSFDECAFGRKRLAEGLTRVFDQTPTGLVVSVEGDWGSGKTTFVKMWMNFLVDMHGFTPIYYNAFEHDFSGDPFASLAMTLYGGLKEANPEFFKKRKGEDQKDALWKATKSLAVNLTKMTFNLALLVKTGGMVTGEMAEKFTFDILKVRADEKLQAYLENEKEIEDYRIVMRDVLAGNSTNQSERKIVVFVDELDRCQPLFAVDLIEKLKHLFEIDGVYFVLAVKMEQLHDTAKRVYGLDEQGALAYFQKFIDLSASLPKDSTPDNQAIVRILRRIFNDLDHIKLLDEKFLRPFSNLLKELHLSPRSIERIASLTTFSLRTYSSDLSNDVVFCVFGMAALKIYSWENEPNSRDSLGMENRLNSFEYARHRKGIYQTRFNPPDLDETKRGMRIVFNWGQANISFMMKSKKEKTQYATENNPLIAAAIQLVDFNY